MGLCELLAAVDFPRAFRCRERTRQKTCQRAGGPDAQASRRNRPAAAATADFRGCIVDDDVHAEAPQCLYRPVAVVAAQQTRQRRSAFGECAIACSVRKTLRSGDDDVAVRRIQGGDTTAIGFKVAMTKEIGSCEYVHAPADKFLSLVFVPHTSFPISAPAAVASASMWHARRLISSARRCTLLVQRCHIDGRMFVSHKLKAHEFLHIQEHIRSEAVVAQKAQQLAQQCQDPQLRSFVEEHGRMAEQNMQKLLSFLQS